MTTSRLRIYSGTTGQLLLDSADAEGDDERDERSALVEESYQSGVLLYYDPGGEVRCYVQIYRHAPEQFVAVYEADSARTDDLLSDCKATVEEHVRRRNWSVETGAGSNQAAFDNLDSSELKQRDTRERVDSRLRASLEGSPLSLSDVWGWLEEGEGVELVAPDVVSSVATLEYVRTALDGEFAVAISRSGRTGAVQSADVVIRPDSSARTVAVSAETTGRIRETRLERLRAKAREAIDKLHAALPDAGATVAALRQAGVEERFDVALRPAGAPSPSHTAFRTASTGVGTLAVVAAIGYTLFSAGPAFRELLSRPISVRVPLLPTLPYVPTLEYRLASWSWLLGLVVVLLLALGPTVAIRQPRLPRGNLGSLVSGRSLGRPPARSSDPSRDGGVDTDVLTGVLSSLDRYERSDESFRDTLVTLLRRVDVEVRSRAERQRARRVGTAGGVVVGLLCGGAVLVVASFATSFVLTVLSNRWVTFLQGLTYLAGIAAVGRLLVLVRPTNRDARPRP